LTILSGQLAKTGQIYEIYIVYTTIEIMCHTVILFLSLSVRLLADILFKFRLTLMLRNLRFIQIDSEDDFLWLQNKINSWVMWLDNNELSLNVGDVFYKTPVSHNFLLLFKGLISNKSVYQKIFEYPPNLLFPHWASHLQVPKTLFHIFQTILFSKKPLLHPCKTDSWIWLNSSGSYTPSDFY